MLINETAFSFLEEYEDNDFEIVFLLEYYNAFKPGVNLVLAYTENDGKDYFIFFRSNFGCAKKCKISNEDAQNIEEILENGRISIIPPEAFGLDGHSYILTFLRDDNFAQYRWWCEADDTWGVFGELIDIVFKYVKSSDGYETKNIRI